MDPVTSGGDVSGGDRPRLDHLVYAVPDLESGAARVEELLGVPPEVGGRHLGLGTWNRLVGLEGGGYLEIVAPDPEQPEPDRPRWFGLDDPGEPRLVTWCVQATDPLEVARRGRHSGIDLGEVVEGSRERPDGSLLSWRFTDPWAPRADGVIPFFIDWGDSPHPSETLTTRCRVADVRVEHPDAVRVEAWLRELGLDTRVSRAHAPRVVATLQTPNGTVELS
ncbi:MAG: VOC family protein [Longimicrobiales bacterium]|nr:VOC family protein [Longimicrobiales bacterium]